MYNTGDISQMNLKKIIIVAGVVVFFVFAFFVIFNSALHQGENNRAIMRALPRVLLGSHAVQIDDETYLSHGGGFERTMEDRGFTRVEQLGSMRVYTKDGKRYEVTGRQYSSYFMLFTVPEEY